MTTPEDWGPGDPPNGLNSSFSLRLSGPAGSPARRARRERCPESLEGPPSPLRGCGPARRAIFPTTQDGRGDDRERAKTRRSRDFVREIRLPRRMSLEGDVVPGSRDLHSAGVLRADSRPALPESFGRPARVEFHRVPFKTNPPVLSPLPSLVPHTGTRGDPVRRPRRPRCVRSARGRIRRQHSPIYLQRPRPLPLALRSMSGAWFSLRKPEGTS